MYINFLPMKLLLTVLLLYGIVYFTVTLNQYESVKRNHAISRDACLTKYNEYKDTSEIFSYMDCVRSKTSKKSHELYKEMKEKTHHEYLKRLFFINDIMKSVQHYLLIIPIFITLVSYVISKLFKQIVPDIFHLKYLIVDQYLFALLWEYLLYQFIILVFRVLPLANTSGHLILIPFISYLLISNAQKMKFTGIAALIHYLVAFALLITLCFTAFIYHSFEDGLYSLPIAFVLMSLIKFKIIDRITMGSVSQISKMHILTLVILIIANLSDYRKLLKMMDNVN